MATDTDEMFRADGLSEVLSSWKESSGSASPGAIEPAFWLDQSSLDDLYRTNVYAQRICCALPDEATRRGWEITYGDDVEGGDDPIGDELWRVGMRDLLNRAGKLARKDGISAIYLGVDDGQEVTQAVDTGRIRRVTHATLMERDQFQPHSWQNNFLEPGFSEPDVYAIYPYSATGTSVPNAYVHRSRMIVLSGIWLPPRLQNENSNSHDSVLQRCWRLVVDFRRTEGDLGVLLRSYSTGIMTMPQLQALLSGKNREAALERLRMISLSRDVLGTVLLGEGEKMEYVTRSVAGLADLYDRQAQGIAATAEMALTVLFGHSPSGLSTDDEAGWRWWKTRVAAYQHNELSRHVEYVGRLLALAKGGPCKGEEPEKWEVTWLPLDEQSEGEKTEQRSKQASTDKTYLEMGVLSAGEVRQSRFGRGQWSGETALIEGEDPTQGTPPGAPAPGAPSPGGLPGAPTQKADSDDGIVTRDAAIRRASLVLAARMRVDLAYDVPADYFREVLGQTIPFVGEPGAGAPLAGHAKLLGLLDKGASEHAKEKAAASVKAKAHAKFSAAKESYAAALVASNKARSNPTLSMEEKKVAIKAERAADALLEEAAKEAGEDYEKHSMGVLREVEVDEAADAWTAAVLEHGPDHPKAEAAEKKLGEALTNLQTVSGEDAAYSAQQKVRDKAIAQWEKAKKGEWIP